MERLFELQHIIIQQIESLPFSWRTQFNDFVSSGPVCGILGARGVGKTTFLLRHAISLGAKQRKALYVSADNAFFLTHRLSELVEFLYKHTETRNLFIDEIHKYPHWKMELKNIIDSYPSFQIFFSGSSMIDLIEGKYDLSRRVVLHHLHGLSFREYLEFYQQLQLPQLKLDDVVKHHREIAQNLNTDGILNHFNDYLKLGYYPFMKGKLPDKDKFQLLDNAVQMAIYEDIATLHTLKTPSLSTIERLYQFVLNSSPGELNASKLATLLAKDFDSISTYLRYLEQAGLLRFIYPNLSGGAFLRNPIKMYPDNTNLMHAAHLPLAQDQFKGKARETFFVNQVQNSGRTIFYSKIGDFKVEDYVFEVGGKGKTTKQLHATKNAYILSDDIFIGTETTIPLYLMGFLY